MKTSRISYVHLEHTHGEYTEICIWGTMPIKLTMGELGQMYMFREQEMRYTQFKSNLVHSRHNLMNMRSGAMRKVM